MPSLLDARLASMLFYYVLILAFWNGGLLWRKGHLEGTYRGALWIGTALYALLLGFVFLAGSTVEFVWGGVGLLLWAGLIYVAYRWPGEEYGARRSIWVQLVGLLLLAALLVHLVTMGIKGL